MMLSVLLCVYNGERYLTEALDGLLAQTWKDFEVIIIDDCSTDATPKVLASYRDERFRVFRNETNIGLTKSLQKALPLTTGEFVARQDADDISHPDRFHKQIMFLEKNPNVGVVASSYEIMDVDGTLLNVRRIVLSPAGIRRALYHRNFLVHGSQMLRRTALDEVGGYRPEFRYAQDYDLLLRLMERWDIGVLADPLYSLRLSLGSVGHSHLEKQNYFARLARSCYDARSRAHRDTSFLKYTMITHTPTWREETAVWVYDTTKANHMIQSGKRQAARDLLSRMESDSHNFRWWSLYVMTYLPMLVNKILFRMKWKWEAI